MIFWTASTLGLELLGSFGAIGTFPILAWSGLVAAIGVGDRGGPAGSVRAEGPAESPRTPAGWEATISLALVLAGRAASSRSPRCSSAVKVVSDGPIYHLYFAARWWKAGRLILVAAPFGENAATYFPANGDLWFTWLMATWGGDTLAKVGQAPFLLLAGRRPTAVPACWGSAARPPDRHLLVRLVHAAVALLVRAERRHDLRGRLPAGGLFLPPIRARPTAARRPWSWARLAAGEALGTKPIGVVFVPPLLALVIAGAPAPARAVAGSGSSTPRDRRARPAGHGRLLVPPQCLAHRQPALSAGRPRAGPHPLGRLVRTRGDAHQPLLPARRRLGALADIAARRARPPAGPVWLAAVAGAWAVGNPRTRSVRVAGSGCSRSVAVLNVALYWVVIPYRTQQRFMLQALGLAVVPLAATLDRGRWLRIGATVLLALHILTPQTWPFPARERAIPWDLSPLIPNAIGSLVVPVPAARAGGIDLDRGRQRPSRHPPDDSRALPRRGRDGLGLADGLDRCDVRDRRWRLADPDHLGHPGVPRARLRGSRPAGARPDVPVLSAIPRLLRRLAGVRRALRAAGGRVAYAGTNIPYYFLGQGLRNEVRYVNVDGHRDWLLHDYHREALARGQGHWPNSRPGWDRIRPDYRAWLDNLDAEGIQLLVVTAGQPGGRAAQRGRRRGLPDRAPVGRRPPRAFVRSTARTSATPGSGSTG